MIYPDWPAPDVVRALTTTRRGGISNGPWASLNLADHVGDDPLAVRENRGHLHKVLDLPSEPVWLQQVHGYGVVETAECLEGVSGAGSGSCSLIIPPQADASVARVPGQVSVVLTADCLPVVFCDRAGSCVAAAHAGWRGLAAGVLEHTVQAMGVDAGELLVWLGPAIGANAFEVGSEVRVAFVEQHPDAVEAFTPVCHGRWLADLYQLARIRLSTIGVQAVYGGDHCTFTEADDFYSYRRDGVTGRMATLIWLR